MTSTDLLQEHDRLVRDALDRIKPCLPSKGSARAVDNAGIAAACRMLERALVIVPKNFAAWWFLGLGHRLLNEDEAAYDSLKQAYSIAPEKRDVAREFIIQCIRLGKGAEAVAASAELLRRWMNDPGLIANHALALLIAGDPASALVAASESLRIAPTDVITKDLYGMIQDIIAGRKRAPSRWPDDSLSKER